MTQGVIAATDAITPAQIQPNSLDLRLDSVGYRVQCSFLPGDEGIQQKLARYKWYEFSMPAEGVVLERNQAYIFPLCESLSLPEAIYARANPKSTTGRLDVFTRLVTEHGTTFDEVRAGYQGRLYLEVVPRSFAIRVRTGDSLAQIRFQVGNPHLTREETVALLDSEHLILDPNLRTLRSQDLPVATALVLSISLPKKNEPLIGYQARRNTPPIDLRAVGGSRISHYWDRIHGGSKPIILEPGRILYLREPRTDLSAATVLRPRWWPSMPAAAKSAPTTQASSIADLATAQAAARTKPRRPSCWRCAAGTCRS